MAQQKRKPPKKQQPSGKGSGLPGMRDFLINAEWSHEVYWCVIRKALLALALGITGLVAGYYRVRAGDLAGAGLCWGGLSLLGSRWLAPTQAEFEFLGSYNRFILNPPVITVAEDAAPAGPAGVPAAGMRVAGEQ